MGTTFLGDGATKPPFILQGAGGTRPSSQLLDFLSLYFYIFIFLWFGNAQHIPALCAIERLHRRQVAAGAYSTVPYWIAAVCVRIPALLLVFTLFLAFVYPMCSFTATPSYFFFVYTILFLTSLMSFYIAQFVASATQGDATLSFAVVPPLFMVFVLVSGAPMFLTDLPPWIASFAPYFSFLRWSYEGLVTYEMSSQGISVFIFFVHT